MNENPIIPAANRSVMTPQEKGAALRADIIDRAEELRDQANDLFHQAVDFAKQRPYAAAAIVGGVAATAAAAVYGGSRLAASRATAFEDDTFDLAETPAIAPGA
ncbi:MAG: hypothetical protein DI623_15325 [Sphingomonas sanxanigenens]|uniref:Uncharacterized protein n=1 Tax=Sphingomonas sanxanigenens TaxID=397260 RepID=A0A2W5A3V8_9SPHN|nr:MAG: hypothetical protein DI623_15325 [Sphingomonas sanxanigenens]